MEILERRIEAVESDQRQLRIAVQSDIAELTAEVNKIGERTAAHLSAIMDEWQALAGRMAKLVREHGQYHGPNGKEEP